MKKYDQNVMDLCECYSTHGLHNSFSELPVVLKRRIWAVMEDVSKLYPQPDLIAGIKYGMKSVWPFSNDDHPVFSVADFRKHLDVAVAKGRQAARKDRVFSPGDVREAAHTLRTRHD
jgi:hypothetical protein